MTEQPTATRIRFTVKYVIADDFGDIRWMGTCTPSQDAPIPADELTVERLMWEALLVRSIRRACDTDPSVPRGRVVLLAIIPTRTAEKG